MLLSFCLVRGICSLRETYRLRFGTATVVVGPMYRFPCNGFPVPKNWAYDVLRGSAKPSFWGCRRNGAQKTQEGGFRKV